jgi:hypothetical protein
MMPSARAKFLEGPARAVKITTAMAPSPLRRLLDERVSQLLADADALAGESRDRAARECADRLNQAARRLRQAENLEALGATLADAAAGFATGAAVFTVDGQTARLESVRGLEAEEVPARFQIPLDSAPAMTGAIETRDPVMAAAVPGEVSSALVDLMGHTADMRLLLAPLVAGERVPAILYAWGELKDSALELLAQVAAAEWEKLAAPPEEPAKLEPLVTIVAAEAPPKLEPLVAVAASEAPKPANPWEALSADDQQIHLRAQRFARVQVAEMRLFQAEAVQAGRAQRDLYDALRTGIDGAREQFREKFIALCPSMVDYLHLELVRTLAHEDAEMLGAEYPGPLV